MGSIVRRVVAVAVVLAIQAAALNAPLVHAHPDEHATAHHAGRAVHTHWGGHAHAHDSADAPAVQADDHDRAVSLTAFVAVAASALPAPGLPPAHSDLPVPAEQRAHRTADVVRSHDPPQLSSLPSRAPPTCLS